VGGLISTNAGGTQVLRHGNMRSQVLGLEAVLADGSIYSALTPLKKDNRGFDLKQLFIGSEGTLGIVTAATLKLEPALADRRVIWAGVESIQAARALLLHAEKAVGEALEGFEVILTPACWRCSIMPRTCVRRWKARINGTPDRSGGRCGGGANFGRPGGSDVGRCVRGGPVAGRRHRQQRIAGRGLLGPARNRADGRAQQGPAKQHDISVPVEKMPDFITDAIAKVEAAWPGTHAVAFGHLGDGNVHFHVISPQGSERAAWEAGDGKAISRFVHDLVTQWGGSLSAEHGIGQMKVAELQRLGDPTSLGLMRAVKAALDPKGILNPGKLLPSA
jgi:FAD/FMN-containing dehydrogenase